MFRMFHVTCDGVPQIDGVKFLFDLYIQGRGGLLCDDMGLGKTLQVKPPPERTFHRFVTKIPRNFAS